MADRTGFPVVSGTAPTVHIPAWISIVVLLGAALTALGAIVALERPAMMLSPNAAISEGVRVYAGYLVSRNLAIAIALVALLAVRARRTLSGLMFLVATIQLFDAVIDCIEGRWMIVPGIMIFGLVYLVAAIRLAGRPLWHSETWRD